MTRHERRLQQALVAGLLALVTLIVLLLLSSLLYIRGAEAAATPALALLRPWPSYHQPRVHVQTFWPGCEPRAQVACNHSVDLDTQPVLRAGESAEGRATIPVPVCGCVECVQRLRVFCAGVPNTAQHIQTYSLSPVRPLCPPVHTQVDQTTCDQVVVTLHGQTGSWWVDTGLHTSMWSWNASQTPRSSLTVRRSQAASFRLIPVDPACPPRVFEASFSEASECQAAPPSLRIDWSAWAPVWLILAWTSIYACFLLGIANGIWRRFPRVGAVAVSLLLAAHVPLMAHMPFTWYAVSTLASLAVPILAVGCYMCWVVSKGHRRFHLPTAKTLEGIGQLAVFVLFQVAVLALALALGE